MKTVKFTLSILIALAVATSALAPAAHAASGGKEITVYDPADAIHPFKLLSIIIRPPVALVNKFIKGGYWVLDSEPTRRAFNIDYSPTINIDDDY
ncbi:MAG: hypothetical protein ACT4NX_05075 [Deltaproteobacteria bacterium]